MDGRPISDIDGIVVGVFGGRAVLIDLIGIGSGIGERLRTAADRHDPDAEALGRLSEALDREGVIAAMLIGSQARGTAGPLSDVDIAVWRETSLDPSARLSLRLSLASAAARSAPTRSTWSCSTARHRCCATGRSAMLAAWSRGIRRRG
jgi:predicted nucleotidyltransferase